METRGVPSEHSRRSDSAGRCERLHHLVQFYESDAFLSEAVTSFLADGLSARQPVLMIATPERRADVRARLGLQGFDVQRLSSTGALHFCDARTLLSTFMVGSMPDQSRFRHSLDGVLKRQPVGDESLIRAYGEMVDVLCRDGNPDAAVRLEELWNELANDYALSLMCAYHMGNFYTESHGRAFQQICSTHTHVIPAESYDRHGDSQKRLREIVLLQQRAGALEAELRHRKELEKALREALAYRRRAEAEREQLLQAEQRARVDAEEASRVKDEFLAVLSHELRTPLNAILGWTQIVTQSRTDQTTLRHALEVIQRNAHLQLHLINDLLDVSRIVAGKMQVKREPVDLAAVVTSATESFRPDASAKDIQLDLHVDESARLTLGDEDRLQQVVWNLLSNALKFTPEHGRIEIQLRRSGAHAQIVVRDSGQGIDPEFLPHVFNRFSQENSTPTRGHGGLGLGLAVSRHLVEAHDGTLSAESAGTGLGSTFAITLPLVEQVDVSA
jgi:signal transduction histidine kinase